MDEHLEPMRMQDQLVVIGAWDDPTAHSLRLQDFVVDGEPYIPLFSDADTFKRLVAGTPYEKDGLVIDRQLLASILRGDELLILDPGHDSRAPLGQGVPGRGDRPGRRPDPVNTGSFLSPASDQMAPTTDRLTLFSNALREIEQLRQTLPNMPTIVSVVHQLEYLIAVESGRTADRSRLAEIVLGQQAAREIEPLDQRCAEMLHEVSDHAKTMRCPQRMHRSGNPE